MRKLVAITVSLAASVMAFAQSGTTITGAGATFPFPIYSKWAFEYGKASGVKLNYQSIGSGGGIAQIKAKTVDFGASDAPLDAKELEEAGLVQFPMVVGGVVPVVNIVGVAPGALKLSPDVLADIYLGKITKWSDARIVELNKELKLPNKDISVVYRADGSGTTWLFTNYLNKVSQDWSSKVGFGRSVKWPVGIGGKGNEGVSANVQRIDGSIGYVELAYALQNKLAYTKLKNAAGNFVEPSLEAFQAATANADWKNTPGMAVVVTNAPGEKSWPITGASFILMHKEVPASKKANIEVALKFFDWCYKNGADMARSLDFVPIPENVANIVREMWKNQIKSEGKSVY